MPTGSQKCEELFRIGTRWVTAEELESLRKGLGSADEILERNRALREIIDERRTRKVVWLFVKRMGLAFAAIAGAVLTLKHLGAGWLW